MRPTVVLPSVTLQSESRFSWHAATRPFTLCAVMTDAAHGGSPLLALTRMLERVDRARQDSDVALFFDLMYAGEMVTKLVTSAMVAAIHDDRDRNRYRLEHKLVRADGIGEWVEALEDSLIGPASQHLSTAGRRWQRDITKLWGGQDAPWQWEAVHDIDRAAQAVGAVHDTLPSRVSLRSWFARFVALRNRTRGHGAILANECERVCGPLERSLDAIVANLSLFAEEWAYLHRNLSGKYRVVPISQTVGRFAYLKSENLHSLADGVYIFADEPRRLTTMLSDVDLTDFLFANGGFKGTSYEALSYITDDRRQIEATDFATPPTPLPESETEGRSNLDVQGHSFGNLPQRLTDYVSRKALEDELMSVLRDDRHPVITLSGRGGTGKTSLALESLHRLADAGTFFALVWFSARDIDLLSSGPKLVRPAVLTREDMAAAYANLMAPPTLNERTFDSTEYLAHALASADGSTSTLFVFDNFETVRHPSDLFSWLDTYVRLPNKVLITTRFRDFKGDYAIEVGGMSEPEFAQLVALTADRLGIAPLLGDRYLADLYRESGGHPYVVKILLGEVARAGSPVAIHRIMATREDVLSVLFERTFAALHPTAQRVFLTLCHWRSAVPQLALEAALLRPENDKMEVSHAIEVLRRSALVDAFPTSDDEDFLQVPLAAMLFGRKKLRVSPFRAAIEADVEVLGLFGSATLADARKGLQPRIGRLLQHVAQKLQTSGEGDLGQYMPLLEYVARRFPATWLGIADLQEETLSGEEGLRSALDSVTRFLEESPEDAEAWSRKASLCRSLGDTVGEMQARVELALLRGASYADISNTANRLNALLRENTWKISPTDRRALLEQLRNAMIRRIAEANATDCSRLAWLCIHLRDSAGAGAYVNRGLELDPDNHHCQALAERL